MRRLSKGVLIFCLGAAAACDDTDKDLEEDTKAQDAAAYAAEQARNSVSYSDNGRANDASMTEIYDIEEEIENSTLGITFTRIRISTTNAPNYSPTNPEAADKVYIETWYELASESGTQFVNTSFAYSVDDDGWLYYKSLIPGTVLKQSASSDSPDAEYQTFTVTAPDTLLTSNYAVKLTSGLSSSIRSATGYPWGGLADKTGISFASSTEFVVNDNNTTKGNMGCYYYNGTTSTGGYHFAEVEAGHLDYVPYASGGSAIARDDNETVIAYDHTWHITGINLNTGKLRIMKKSLARLYQGRQMPGTFTANSTTAPTISGIESLIRSCNDLAENGYFYPLFVNSSETISAGSQIYYCSDLDAANTANAATVPLSQYYSNCSWSPAIMQHGSWNGTSHNSTVSTTTISYKPYTFTVSDVAEIDLAAYR